MIVCLARYKTRPGLTYHYNHSHKDRDLDGYSLPEPEEHAGSPSTGSDSLDAPPGSRGAYSGYPGPDHANLDEGIPASPWVRVPPTKSREATPPQSILHQDQHREAQT